MRAVIQRVSSAQVNISGRQVAAISTGILILLGIEKDDTQKEAEYLADKIVQLRIFPDDEHHMNRSVMDIGGDLLVVSQFTLLGNCRKGRRPSFSDAADPAAGNQLYHYFIEYLLRMGITVETGEFGAMMDVVLVNDGPVTLIIDSRRWLGDRVPIP